MLPKCWRRINGKIVLYKGGTQGASNTGFEPYSEFYAAQIGQILGIPVVPYSIAKWKNIICSTCELFTSKEFSFVPVGRIVRRGGMAAVKKYYASLGEPYENALHEMFLLDALIFNTDRHYGNFGFLVENRTNRIFAPAPLFDHGNSLLSLAGRDVWHDKKSVERYADTLLPCVYDDYLREAKAGLTHEQKNRIRKLLDFRFKRHSRYNLSNERLALIEYAVQKRAAALLEE